MVDLSWLYQTLRKNMGPSGWWPADSKQEIILGAILVQNTNWQNAAVSLKALKKATNYDAKQILALSNDQLIDLIRPSGFYKNKSKAIQSVYGWFEKQGWNYHQVRNKIGKDLRKELLDLHGVGQETADVFLVYVFDLPEFIADSYTRRLFKQLGYKKTKTYRDLKFQVSLPDSFDYKDAQDFHGLIDNFGKVYLRDPAKFAGSFLGREIALRNGRKRL
mgnify:CR=1 FL=1